MIQLQHISKTYNKGKPNETVVLRDLDLIVETGDFLAVMGPSGSGKSTLLHIMEGIETADSGRCLYDGTDLTSSPDSVRAKIRNRDMGIVLQDYGLLGDCTVFQNLCIPGLIAGKKRREQKQEARRILKELGIEELSGKKAACLSGGQKQRAAIGRALMCGAGTIFADEPTGALDHQTGEQVMEILQRLNQEGKTIIMVTHDEGVAGFAKKVIQLFDGRILP